MSEMNNKLLVTVDDTDVVISTNIDGVITSHTYAFNAIAITDIVMPSSTVQVKVFNFDMWASMDAEDKRKMYDFYDNNDDWLKLIPPATLKKMDDWDWSDYFRSLK